jgi:hypothetical protein
MVRPMTRIKARRRMMRRTIEFQDTSKVFNIIFSGDSSFPTKRSQKLILHEIMTIK